eukprot:1134539-Pelagomonas_calceolata.AAC.2
MQLLFPLHLNHGHFGFPDSKSQCKHYTVLRKAARASLFEQSRSITRDAERVAEPTLPNIEMTDVQCKGSQA